LLFLLSCKNDKNVVKPVVSGITESVYASGILKSEAQYQAYPAVSGTIAVIFLSEGDQVKVATPILANTNEVQVLNTQNAELAAQYASINNNQNKLNDAKNLIALQQQKMKNDSLLLRRQQNVWHTGGGTKVEMEQRA
jgi:HlyD family secretion protein